MPPRVKVLFYHKKRPMFFYASMKEHNGEIRIAIPDELYPESTDGCPGLERLYFPDLAGSRFAVFPDSVTKETRRVRTDSGDGSGYAALSEKAGLAREDLPAAIALAAYLDGIQTGKNTTPNTYDAGQIIHCDHRTIIAVFPASFSESVPEGSIHVIKIQLLLRSIVVKARCVRLFPVTASAVAVTVSFLTLQEEDKRLLFERAYDEKYCGEK